MTAVDFTDLLSQLEAAAARLEAAADRLDTTAPPLVYTPAEAADALHLSERTVRDLARSGRIATLDDTSRVLFSRAALERYANGGAIRQGAPDLDDAFERHDWCADPGPPDEAS